MERPMIYATLFNVGTDNDEYQELREQMITDLTADELHQPAHILRDMLEDYTARMFADMEDDVLQDTYDNLMEAKNEVNEEAEAQEDFDLGGEG
jgi:hypothetical protein